MAKWAPEGFGKSVTPANLLADILSPKAKQATLAAIEKFGTLRQGTWNGCVFNAAGRIENRGVSSISSAAEVFEMSPQAVSRFIRSWDSFRTSRGTDPTAELRKALSTPTAFAGKEFEVIVHESEATRLEREFGTMVENLDLPWDEMSRDQQDFADSVATAAELIFA